MPILRLASALPPAVALLIALAPLPAAGQGQSADRTDLSFESLKGAYLDCERTAIAGRLDTGEIMRCSVLYEDLKRRAFGGDSRALKRWSDRQPGLRLDPLVLREGRGVDFDCAGNLERDTRRAALAKSMPSPTLTSASGPSA